MYYLLWQSKILQGYKDWILVNLNVSVTETFWPHIGHIARFMQQPFTGCNSWNLLLFFHDNQGWFYLKGSAASLTEQPTRNLCMHICPYRIQGTVISTNIDLTSILVTSTCALFSEFWIFSHFWTFRRPSRLQKLLVSWNFLHREHFIAI